jgi:uncharacterized damage-inducible protein DinB
VSLEDLTLLYDFNTWANRRTLDACDALSDVQFVQDLGSSFASVRETLAHLMLVEWLWLERWKGHGPDRYPPSTEFPNLAAIRARWAQIESDLLSYIASLKPEDLHRVIHHKTMAGAPQAQPLWQMLQHLVNHGTYHRGQVATMLRQLGAKTLGTDLILYYREQALRAQP